MRKEVGEEDAAGTARFFLGASGESKGATHDLRDNLGMRIGLRWSARSAAKIGYGLAVASLAVTWVVSGSVPALVVLLVLTFPVGYVASLPIGLAVGVMDLALGITDDSVLSVVVAALVSAVGYAAVAVVNIAILRFVSRGRRTRKRRLVALAG